MARKKSQAAANGIYSVHPGVDYVCSLIANLPDKTGKSLEEWVQVVEASGPEGEKERRAWLRSEHGLGGPTAGLIAEQFTGKDIDMADPERYLEAAAGYVEKMYSGGKSHLRPIHDALIKLGQSMGSDVRICPCRTIVPLYRNYVFAEIKPSTKTRIDFGLALKGCKRKPIKRLVDTGGMAKGNRITHCFRITSEAEVDETVEQWLQIAYDLDQ